MRGANHEQIGLGSAMIKGIQAWVLSDEQENFFDEGAALESLVKMTRCWGKSYSEYPFTFEAPIIPF